jgi:hypothetical protein
MPTDLRDATAAQLLDAATASVRTRRLLQVHEFDILLAWSDLHSADPLEGLEEKDAKRATRMGNVLRQVGGEGTPGVQDFALPEIALACEAGVVATRHKLADALDLRHRLPLTWAACRTGDAEIWVAAKIAKLSRDLPLDRVWIVDQAVARVITTEGVTRIFDVAEGKITEAAPAIAEEAAEHAEATRFAAVGQSDDDGMRMLVSKMTASDAAGVDAVLDALAAHVLTAHPDLTLDERRSIALGMFGRLGQLLKVLLTGIDPNLDPNTDPDSLARALAIPAEVLDLLRDPTIAARLAPQATLYVHLHETALLTGDGVARVEGLGPATLAQLQVLLAGHHVTIKPVIDLNDRVTTVAYEHPETIKERVHLTVGRDYWPWANSTSRRVDYDHPTPYDPQAPPGTPAQTGTHNSGPLGRQHHRWKTPAGYRSRQCGPGRYVWTTPHGLAFLVDHRGTRAIPLWQAQAMLDLPDGAELYYGDPDLVVEYDLAA